MDKVIIAIAYILTFYLFYNLITLIMALVVIWNIFR